MFQKMLQGGSGGSGTLDKIELIKDGVPNFVLTYSNQNADITQSNNQMVITSIYGGSGNVNSGKIFWSIDCDKISRIVAENVKQAGYERTTIGIASSIGSSDLSSMSWDYNFATSGSGIGGSGVPINNTNYDVDISSTGLTGNKMLILAAHRSSANSPLYIQNLTVYLK